MRICLSIIVFVAEKRTQNSKETSNLILVEKSVAKSEDPIALTLAPEFAIQANVLHARMKELWLLVTAEKLKS